jgi:murein DD-endopeptidase MepM/ murein hydrolase activator NlpD
VGEMQAKLVKLEAMGERVSGLAGMKPEEIKPLHRGGGAASAPAASDSRAARGGPYVPLSKPSLEQLQHAVKGLDEAADLHTDLFTYFESRLQESRLTALMVPSAPPVDGAVGSGFGFRSDPFNGRAALHTGLDFPAEIGTPIKAAAGGIVISKDTHPAYGNVLEIDHGNGLVTRYAHCSSIEVNVGAVVKRGQVVAKVGNTGRSTGSHLHFEVLVDGVPQDPAKFLAAGAAPKMEFAARPGARR